MKASSFLVCFLLLSSYVLFSSQVPYTQEDLAVKVGRQKKPLGERERGKKLDWFSFFVLSRESESKMTGLSRLFWVSRKKTQLNLNKSFFLFPLLSPVHADVDTSVIFVVTLGKTPGKIICQEKLYY